MTDPWVRPPSDRTVVEIELTDTDTNGRSRPASAPATGDRPHGAGRGRRLGLVAAGAVGAAVVATLVAGTGDDAPDGSAASTTIDATGITTPPTLAPLDTIPPVTAAASDVPDGTGPAAESAPSVTVDPTTITVPTFPIVEATGDLDAYDLLAAVAANAPGGTPMRTFLAVQAVQEDGLLFATTDVEVAGDADSAFDTMTIEGSLREPAQLIVDRDANVVYRTLPATLDGQWEEFAAQEFTADTGTDDIASLFDAFLSGPITPATLAASQPVADDDLVVLQDGSIARRYTVTVPVDALRPYGMLLFASVFEGSVADGRVPPELTFDVYVTDRPSLALVTARFSVDDVVYVVEQSFDRRPAEVTIELPPADRVSRFEPAGPQPTAPNG